MNDVQSRYSAAVGGLVLIAVVFGLSIWLAGGYVSGGLALALVTSAVYVGKVAGQRRKIREEARRAATVMAALVTKRSELGEGFAGDGDRDGGDRAALGL